MAPCTSCSLLRSSDCRSQHFCDVCKYMFRMDQGNGHNNQCSNHVFTVYAFCHHCSTEHKVPNRLGSTMLCLSNSSLSNTTHHNLAHHHPMTVNNQSTFFQGDDGMHDNNDSSTSNNVDNASNCCVIPVTAMSPPPFSKVVVPMKIQRYSSMD
jgi:rubredoxin